MSDWQLEQLRFTGFLSPLFDTVAVSVFQSVTGSEPVQTTENRQQAMQSAGGPFGGGKADVVKLPGRLDILLHPTDDAPPGAGSATVGTWGENKELFDAGIRSWLGSKPRLQRMALGVVCLRPTEDGITGYQMLDRLLPKVDIDVEHSSDFFYQINRPRLAKFDDAFSCKINRLSKWSTAAVVSHTFTFAGGRSGSAAPSVAASVRHYCRAELDLSTDPEVGELPSQNLELVWTRLLEYAEEVLLNGDIP